MLNRIITALSLMVLSVTVQASIFSYKEITLGSEAVAIPGSTGTVNAFGVGAMFPVRDRLFVTARYATGSGTVDDVDLKVNGTSLGLGTYLRIARETDIVGGVYLATGSMGLSSGGMTSSVSSAKDSFYIGFRTLMYPAFELSGYYNLSLTGNSTQIGLRYYFDRGLGLTAGIASSDTIQSAALGFVFSY